MEYTSNNTPLSSSSRGELEWMRRISSSSSSSLNVSTSANNDPSSTKLQVVLDEDDNEGGVEPEGGKELSKSGGIVIEREHMFDKVVTPSDVGKLNRLVIPKQHAEKYFPLDSTNNEKGLLLNFEDRTGKPWRFRYSYWNSSQSYVMTKGWSRFVKEKKLDAGDIVSFQRGVGEIGKDKLFIDWRRRPDNSSGLLGYPGGVGGHGRVGQMGLGWGSGGPPFVLRSHPHPHQHTHQPYSYPLGLQGGPSGMWDHQLAHHSHPHYQYPARRGPGLGVGMGIGSGSSSGGGGGYGYGYGNVVNNPYPVIFLRPSTTMLSNSSIVQQNAGAGAGVGVGGGVTLSLSSSEDHQERGSSPLMMMQVQGEEGGDEGMVYESVPVVQGKAAAKRLRLFGVNMDCPISHQTHDFDILSSSLASSHHQQNEQNVAISMGPPSSSPISHHHHHHHHHQHDYDHHQLRPLLSSSSSLYNESSSSIPLEKGKSSTSSSMSLDLDI